MVTIAHGFERYWDVYVLAVAENVQLYAGAGLLLADFDLRCAGVAYLLPIDFGDDVTNFEAGFCGRRIVFYLRDDCAFVVIDLEELCVLRGSHR
jgi:hypothetical protein